MLLYILSCLISCQREPYFVTHIRLHTILPGQLVEGNISATRLAGVPVFPNSFEQVQLSHAFFQQNTKVLQKSYGLSLTQAQQIIAACSDCQQMTPSLFYGVNPPRPNSSGIMADRGQTHRIWKT